MSGDLRRFAVIVSPFIFLASIIIFLVFFSKPLLAAAGTAIRPAPDEPIAFDHNVHAGQAGIDCTFCHRGTTQGGNIGGMTAGYPDVQQCMFCHSAVAGAAATAGAPMSGLDAAKAQAEIDKLRQTWQQQRPIDWERIHRMPDHVRFTHEPHLLRGFTCETCHGNVAQMGQVVQVRPLNMGDCLACHRQNGANAECATCHK